MKKTLSAILAFLMVITILPSFTAFAAETEGTCGENATWVYDAVDATLTISGTGVINSEQPWEAYIDEIKTVIIKDGIEGIDDYAFANHPALEEVLISESVTNLGKYIFSNCNALSFQVVILSDIATIPEGMFWGCRRMTITIPTSVTRIEEYAFETLPFRVFYEGAEENWNNIIVEDNNVDFSQVAIEYNYKSSIFEYMKNSKTENTVEITKCTSSIFYLVIPEKIDGYTVTEINDSAFLNSNIDYVVIPNTVTTIGDSAFSGSCIREVTIPDSVTLIDDEAFFDCRSLRRITLPNKAMDICVSAFSNTPYYRDETNWENGLLYIGNHLIEAKEDITGSRTVKSGTKTIAEAAFYKSRLTSVTISSGVEIIGAYAFLKSYVEQVWIPEGVTKIGHNSFQETFISQIILPSTVKSIGGAAFKDCSCLRKITIPYGVTQLEQGTFYGCGALTEVVIPSTVTSISDWVFDTCHNLKNIYYSGSSAQWNKITISVCNDALDTAKVHYNYKLPNGWAKENGYWYYYRNGVILTNTWQKDSVGWCYLGTDGKMVTNKWVKDSVGWCYVGPNGYCVTNKWVKDSIGWCYLGANGQMATNQWIKDSVGWCYVGPDGYCVTNKWVADSHGWCYLDANGRMVTNKWIKDSVGWCYVGSDGYCVTNKWVKDSVGWCYLDENGRMVANAIVSDSNGVCFVGENGYWEFDVLVYDGYGYLYFDETGYMVTDTWIEIDGDSYYVGSDGYIVVPE